MKQNRAFLTVALLAAGLLLGGCPSLQNVRDAVGVATTTISNPVGNDEMAVLESTYIAAAKVAAAYAGVPRCAAAGQRFCRTLSTQRIKELDRKAYSALENARRFSGMKTVSAINAFAAARRAITEFRAAATG